jgi:hypothetical protein
LALSLVVWAQPEAEAQRVVPGEPMRGLCELKPARFEAEGEHWRLEIDDELVAVAREGGRSRWSWTPGFFAGEVRGRLIDLRGGAQHELRLDVSPTPAKLGRERFAELLTELRREQPELVLGSEPATERMGSLGHLDDPLLAYAKLRSHGEDFLASLERVLAEPVWRLRQERRMLAVAQVRRADRRTVLQALRNPQLAALLSGHAPPRLTHGGPRLDAPVVEPHVDEATNRCMKALVGAVLRRVVDCRERLEVKVAKERESGTRTTLASRWGVREAFLCELEHGLQSALRGPVLTQVSRAEITAAGLNAIAAHPVYARSYRLGWRALGLGFEDGGSEDDLWLPPTWELYERWCFVALRRLLRERFGFESLPAVGEPAAELGWSGSDESGRRVWLGFQVECGSWSRTKKRAFRSVSGKRYPDLVVTLEDEGERRWVVLDVKYRASRWGVLDGMSSAHLYHDALRWHGQLAERALLVVPAKGGAPWLEEPGFHAEHGVGVVVAGPGELEGLVGVLNALLRASMVWS